MKNIYSLIVVSFLVGCGGSGGGDDVSTDTEQNIPQIDNNINGSLRVYNHAYNENFDADKVSDIIKEAEDSYILLDSFNGDVTSDDISKMIANNNQVSGYISIGTGEDWRDDYNKMTPYLVTKSWDEWQGEYFIKEISNELIDIMKKRIDKMSELGIKWVEFDNMDWADDDTILNKYGSLVTKEQSIEYYNELCDYLHQKDMKCMAKSTVEGASNFDGVTYESYDNKKNWWDVDGAKSFLDSNKLVIVNHYNEINCDDVYKEYQDLYNSKNISFICEDVATKKYIHY